jgi:hypothetical protein
MRIFLAILNFCTISSLAMFYTTFKSLTAVKVLVCCQLLYQREKTWAISLRDKKKLKEKTLQPDTA